MAGFGTESGTVDGFLKLSNGTVFTLKVPGATMTQAFGVNDGDRAESVDQGIMRPNAASHIG